MAKSPTEPQTKRFLTVAGTHGMQIKSTEGDRLPIESIEDVLYGYPGAEKRKPVKGLRSVSGGTEDDR